MSQADIEYFRERAAAEREMARNAAIRKSPQSTKSLREVMTR